MRTRSRRLASVDQLALPWHQPKKGCTHRCYYLTCAQFDAMRWRAGDRCEICRVRAEQVQKRPLYVDHDGRLGNGFDHVRGLVCARCNAQLRFVDNGYRRPTPEQLRYLDMSWFYELLPPERQGLPWLPPPTDNPHSLDWYFLPRKVKERLGEEARDDRLARMRNRAA